MNWDFKFMQLYTGCNVNKKYANTFRYDKFIIVYKTHVMRALLIVLITFFTVSTLLSQDNEGPFIAFDRELHDFGEIPSDDVPDGKLRFKIFNQGNQPLVISAARACCGTRVNDYTREPIHPADTGYIEVEFRIVPQPHRIRRTVTIRSNAGNRQTAILRIQGEGVEPKGDITLQEK